MKCVRVAFHKCEYVFSFSPFQIVSETKGVSEFEQFVHKCFQIYVGIPSLFCFFLTHPKHDLVLCWKRICIN